jgi:hypothetical protein
MRQWLRLTLAAILAVVWIVYGILFGRADR